MAHGLKNTVFASLAALALGAMLATTIPTTADAWPFGRNRDREAPSAPTNTNQQRTGTTQAPPSATARTPMSPAILMPGEAGTGSEAARPELAPATAEQRRAARGFDAVRQADFWMTELGLNPADREAALEASTLLRRLGSSERAAEVAAIGLQANQNDPALWAALGMALVSDGRGNEAVQSLTRAISFNPRDITLHSALGVAYDMIERPDMAERSYQAALALDPNDSRVLANYGFSMALAGRLLEGEQMLRRAAANPTAPPQARQNLALVVGLQGRFQESEALASQDVPPQVAAENVAYLRQMLAGDDAGSGGSRWQAARPQSAVQTGIETRGRDPASAQ